MQGHTQGSGQLSAPAWDTTGTLARTGRTHHHRRWLRILIICLAILIVVLVAADRVGNAYAEHRIASLTQSKLAAENIDTTGTPSVSIGGFPFLTQVASGDYGQIDIDVPGPSSLGVRLDTLHIRASSVHAPLSAVMHGGAIIAGRVDATAGIDWSNLQNMVDLSPLTAVGIDPSSIQITSTGGDGIRLSAPMTTLGVRYTVTATGTVSLRDGILHVQLSDISPGTDLPSIVASHLPSLPGSVSSDVRVPTLPYNLKIDSVTTDETGVTVKASATDVTIG